MQGECLLLEIVFAASPTRCLAGRLNGRQQDRNQHTYDRDHDEQLDERKTVYGPTASCIRVLCHCRLC